ncbi:MAG: hypothetical protein KF795_28920 [Labilithrix sp.]|nr:hypothetical protein [Labilithrix sp.]
MRPVAGSFVVCALLAAMAGCLEAPTGTTSGSKKRSPDAAPAGDDADDAEQEPSDPAPRSPLAAIVVDLGAVTAGQTVDLVVPKNALGFNVVVASEGAASLGIQTIKNPKDVVVLDSFTHAKSTMAVGEAVEGIASVSVPQNDLPASAPTAGTWRVTFGGEGTNGRAKARVQVTSDAAFHGGLLDVHVHIPAGLKMANPSPSHVVDAASAPADTDLGARIDAFYLALGELFGIERGKVVFHDAPARFVAVNDDPTFYAATAVSAGLPEEQGLHVVLTNDLYRGEYSGYSPGVPGAANVTGTPMSSILVAVDATVDPVSDGYTWLHEAAHFVGLQHTSESDGITHDPLSDTPECRGTRTPQCGDARNLMIPGWWPEGLVLPEATKGQQAVFRGSPIYRAYASGAVAKSLLAGLGGTSSERGTSPSASGAPPSAFAPRRVTASGRQLTSLERWLGGTLCGSAQQSPALVVRERGRDQAIADLQAIARDADLPRPYRTKALRMIERIGHGE